MGWSSYPGHLMPLKSNGFSSQVVIALVKATAIRRPRRDLSGGCLRKIHAFHREAGADALPATGCHNSGMAWDPQEWLIDSRCNSISLISSSSTRRRRKFQKYETYRKGWLLLNHGWQSESADGPKGGWSCVFWSGCTGCSGHPTTTVGCSVVVVHL